MSWRRVYHAAVRVLPAALRDKHGSAIEALFASELRRARERGWARGMLAGAAGVWDVVRRGVYERARARRGVGSARADHRPLTGLDPEAHPSLSATANYGAPRMPRPTTRLLLGRHAASFAIALVALTTVLLALFARKQVPMLAARGMSAGSIAYVLLLAVPFIAAMTIPMAVFVAVLREFTRLGAEGVLDAAQRERHGVRRLVLPVVAGAVVIAGLALVEVAAIVPAANTRLAAMMTSGPTAPNGRTMTLGELRRAERTARSQAARDGRAQAAGFEVEVQKKFALSAACLLLALAGVAIGLCASRGGLWLVAGASLVVFGGYYAMIVTGEDLARQLVVSPAVGMWAANALLLAIALLAMLSTRTPRVSRGTSATAIPG